MYIVISDIFSKGHHLTFMQQYALVLLNQNKKLMILYPEPEKITQYLKENSNNYQNNVIAETIQESSFKLNIHPLFYHYILTLKRWFNLNKTIKQGQKKHQIKVKYVFIAWLDSYLFKYIPNILISLLFRYKWSGLYFHPNHIRINKYNEKSKANCFTIDNILKNKNCFAVAVLDYFIAQKLQYRINKTILNFTDITNISFEPNYNNEITDAIKKYSQNRTVVGFIGFEKRKNIINLIKLIEKYGANDFLFVIVGDIKTDSFEEDEKILLKNFLKKPSDNFLIFNKYLSDGFEYNAVFNLFDIAWACYVNFYTASNILVKASFFKKPVIGSTNNYIHDAIKKYYLGIAANPNNIDEIYMALQNIKIKNFTEPKFTEFYNLHSIETLNKAFYNLDESFDKYERN
ncbi:MAG: hypothetical protein ACK4K9_10400 [Bacteroidia bacterium]